MRSSPLLVESDSGGSRYTHLSASISEEEDGYTVQVRLYNPAKPENAAWGEEIADSLETASMLIAALAAEFSIPQACIKIEIRMRNMKDGTQHCRLNTTGFAVPAAMNGPHQYRCRFSGFLPWSIHDAALFP